MYANTTKSITVFIAEDHELTQLGLKFVLEREPGIVVVGEEADGLKTVSRVLDLQPEVVLMDIGLPSLDGIEATKQIKASGKDIRIIVLTSYDNDVNVFASFSAGADAYCLKNILKDDLLCAIRSVVAGAGWLDPNIAKRVLQVNMERTTPKLAYIEESLFSLTPRELDVLKAVVQGLTNKEISSKLNVSVETVKTHLRHIMEKLAVSDRTQAAVKAMREGLV